MKAAYADPPYLGCSRKHYGDHPEHAIYDTVEGHKALIERLTTDYERWALSCTSGNLRTLLPICPEDVRVMAWIKPFAAFKKGVNPAYVWEPVIVRAPMLPCGPGILTTRDYVVASITLRRGTCGAKPEEFCRWLFTVLGLRPGDELDDLFPGSGAVTRAWKTFLAQGYSAYVAGVVK